MNDSELVEQQPEPKKPFPNFWQASALVLLEIFLTFGIGVILIISFLFINDFFDLSIDESFIEHFSVISILILSTVFLFLITLLGFLFTKTSIHNVFPFKIISMQAFWAVLLFTLGLSILLSELNNILAITFPSIFTIDEDIVIDNILLSVVLTVLITPFVEEFFFRGLLLHGFVPRYGVARAIIYSSILFGLVHIHPAVMVDAFLGGIALGWIFILTGSLIPVIFMHFLNNLIAEYFSRTDLFIPGLTTQNMLQPLIIDGLGLVLFIIGLLWLKRIYAAKS